MSTTIQRKRLITDVARELRAVADEWDDRCGQAFEQLPSEEREVISGKRIECLSNAGLLVTEAIIDFGWRPGNRASRMVPRAHGARGSEEVEPYKQGALGFLRELVAWYYQNPEWRPPGFPEQDPLKIKRSIFSVDNVPGEELKKVLCVIADVLEKAHGPSVDSDDKQSKRVAESRTWTPPPGFVGRKTICQDAGFRKNGKNPAPSTIDVWVKRAEADGQAPEIIQDPATRENHYPSDWIKSQIDRWSPRPSKRNTST